MNSKGIENYWREIGIQTKLKENREVDKYKASLVMKGYKQKVGIDYKEVFIAVTRHDTIRMVIALATQNSWPIFQLDVNQPSCMENWRSEYLLINPLVM